MSGQRDIVGLALGSGSARGWAHIGVLRGLAELGIRPKIVAGCSVGAMVGAAWAARRLDPLESWVLALTRRDVFGLLDLSFGGSLVKGDRLYQIFDRWAHLRIEDLPRRFAAVATDFESGERRAFTAGPLIDAVRASMSMPGLLPPVRLDDRLLVDGGLVDPIPVELCRSLGATQVIAINLNRGIVGARSSRHLAERPDDEAEMLDDAASPDSAASRWDALEELRRRLMPSSSTVTEAPAPGLYEVLVGSLHILQDRVAQITLEQHPPDLELRPQLSDIALLDVHRGEESIAEGRRVVIEAADAIRTLLDIDSA